MPLDGKRLVVQSSYVISVLGEDLQPLVARKLEYAGDTLAQPFTSPTGRTLYLVQPTNPESTIALIDPDHLRVVKQYDVPKVVTFSGSDEYIAYAVEEGYFGSLSLRIQALNGEGPRLPFARGNCYGYSPTFLSAATLIVSGGCSNFTFVDLQKKEMWQQKLPKASGTELRAARNANRFAYELVDHHEDRPSTPLEVDVFDLDKRKTIFSLKVSKAGQRFLVCALAGWEEVGSAAKSDGECVYAAGGCGELRLALFCTASRTSIASGNAKRVHLATAVFAGFDRPLQVMTGDLDSERIGDDLAGALVVFDPGRMRHSDPHGTAVGKKLDVDGVGVTRGNGDDKRLINAVDLFTGPAVVNAKVSVHREL